ncbi:ABC transporter permease [Hymenobacter sp. J193]|uniref:ABC transporter permease n=1 Tax=Hymenobacter sp. J193 TaxID=2898429 RepID=UPI002151D8E2|nr:ABC transporter permease [Hymenobacter sp. J193]MCR5886277.1 ABC transporter permease [Hymenobacter sp. J193]
MLLHAELRKLLPYRTVWILLVLYAVLLAGFVGMSGGTVINGKPMGNSLYAFPGVWSRLTYVASYFNLLLGILLIILIADEFQFRTFRQQVLDGLSRADLIQGKLGIAVGLTTYATLVVLGIGLFFGLTRGPEAAPGAVTAELGAVGLYAVQALGYLSLAALLAFALRKSGLAILAFLLYGWVAEPLVRSQLPDSLDRYFPGKLLSALTPTPGQELLDTVAGPSGALLPTQALPIALAYVALFWLLSYLLLRRDL